jgi:hypothetical protein
MNARFVTAGRLSIVMSTGFDTWTRDQDQRPSGAASADQILLEPKSSV